MRALLLAVAATSLWVGSAAAQDPTALRTQIATAIARGDSVTVGRVSNQLMAMATAASNASWEQIRACGFYAQETRLECVIDIKQSNGYGGPVGAFGSFEFVSFFIDWHSNGFQTSDYVGSGIAQVADGAAGTSVAVYRDFTPAGGFRTSNTGAVANTTTNGPLLRARAILSWGAPMVANPNQVPVFGGVMNFTIRMLPVR